MIVSTYQPFFAPFPAFFYKAHRSDIMVILDDVQFPLRTTWINRNRFKNDQGALWITIPVWKKGLGLQRIYLKEQFGIDTPLIVQSDLGISATGNELLIEICRKMRASNYLTQAAAKKYLDARLFAEADIELRFFTPPSPVYPQLWGEFIHDLSAFDLLFNCGPKGHEILC
jgi:hypothetical protein